MLKPRAIAPGSRLAVVAPASPFARDEFDRGIGEVRRLGFEPVFDETVFARARSYLAGPPQLRADAIRSAWRDPSIDGLIAVRGGYGSAQVLPLLDTGEMRRLPKVFIGYSDVTAVLTFLTTGCGVVAFHGPMLDGRLARGSAGYDERSFIGAVSCRRPLGELSAPGLETVRGGEATGMLLGGTLTQLVASLGTPYAFDPPADYVLFIEDVAERPYRIDRMITQLLQAGLLARASAVVVGELPRCDEPSGEPTARAIVADLLKDFPGPVLVGFPSGHTVGPSLTLPLGVASRVIANGSPRLVIEEAAVE
jgi:muramoyltetrapeptide carboxypeptidase